MTRFDYAAFCRLADRARKERTPEAALPLLAEYADHEMAAYPADAALFLELDLEALGFELRPYTAGVGGFTIHRLPE